MEMKFLKLSTPSCLDTPDDTNKGRFTWGPKSQVPSLDMEAKSQLSSLKYD